MASRERTGGALFGCSFVIRSGRAARGHGIPRGRRHKETREQFEARMKRAMALKRIVSHDLTGDYDRCILRKPHEGGLASDWRYF
jgi:hypothetical protein